MTEFVIAGVAAPEPLALDASGVSPRGLRRLSRDRKKLRKLLSRREVYHRFAAMVHCRINVPAFSDDTYITPFGALKLPAMVIAHADGSSRVLELPRSYQTVVRFADQSH